MPERVNLSMNSGDDEPEQRVLGELPSELQSFEARLAAAGAVEGSARSASG